MRLYSYKSLMTSSHTQDNTSPPPTHEEWMFNTGISDSDITSNSDYLQSGVSTRYKISDEEYESLRTPITNSNDRQNGELRVDGPGYNGWHLVEWLPIGSSKSFKRSDHIGADESSPPEPTTNQTDLTQQICKSGTFNSICPGYDQVAIVTADFNNNGSGDLVVLKKEDIKMMYDIVTDHNSFDGSYPFILFKSGGGVPTRQPFARYKKGDDSNPLYTNPNDPNHGDTVPHDLRYGIHIQNGKTWGGRPLLAMTHWVHSSGSSILYQEDNEDIENSHRLRSKGGAIFVRNSNLMNRAHIQYTPQYRNITVSNIIENRVPVEYVYDNTVNDDDFTNGVFIDQDDDGRFFVKCKGDAYIKIPKATTSTKSWTHAIVLKSDVPTGESIDTYKANAGITNPMNTIFYQTPSGDDGGEVKHFIAVDSSDTSLIYDEWQPGKASFINNGTLSNSNTSIQLNSSVPTLYVYKYDETTHKVQFYVDGVLTFEGQCGYNNGHNSCSYGVSTKTILLRRHGGDPVRKAAEWLKLYGFASWDTALSPYDIANLTVDMLSPIISQNCLADWGPCKESCDRDWIITSPATGSGTCLESSTLACEPGEDSCPDASGLDGSYMVYNKNNQTNQTNKNNQTNQNDSISIYIYIGIVLLIVIAIAIIAYIFIRSRASE